VEAAWADARPSSFGGAPACALGPEWELVYLAVHAARHRWSRLKWLVDVHERCRAGRIDWPRVVETAARFGWSRILGITLGASRALLGTELPAGVRVDPMPAWLATGAASVRDGERWRDALLPARLLDARADRLAYVARLVFRPSLADQRSLPLPAALRSLHRCWRPVRLGGKGAAHLAAGLARVDSSGASE
jgi:hypothetical protein